MTVASFATITHSRPSTTPMPVTIPGRGRLVAVEAPGGESSELEEGSPRVDQPVDPLAGEQLASLAMPCRGALAAAARDFGGSRP